MGGSSIKVMSGVPTVGVRRALGGVGDGAECVAGADEALDNREQRRFAEAAGAGEVLVVGDGWSRKNRTPWPNGARWIAHVAV